MSIKGTYNYFEMGEENISQKFSLRNIDETKKYFVEEIHQNEWTSKMNKKVCTNFTFLITFLF